MLNRETVIISDAPEITLADDEKAGDAMISFYKSLGWNGEDILDPCKVRTTQVIYDKLYDIMYERCPDPVGVGMLMVNRGPGVDAHIKPGKVHLLEGWTKPAELAKLNAQCEHYIAEKDNPYPLY